MNLLDIIALSETKQQNGFIEEKGLELGFSMVVTVPPVGLSRGLVVFWRDYVDISICFSSPNLVDLFVKSNEGDSEATKLSPRFWSTGSKHISRD